MFDQLLRVGWAAAASLPLALAGCGGGSSSSPAPEPPPPTAATCDPSDASTLDECGSVYVAFTDAEGDFLSYEVSVTSLELRKANGAVVQTLPQRTEIDFAQYTELSEFISAAAIPPGVYVEGTITLDYSDAEIFVEAAGEAVPATVVDAAGNPLTVVDFSIQLAERDRLTITRGRPSLLTVDFDLAASHRVDTSVEPAVAVAEPFLVAEVNPVEEKDIRVRGALVEVDVAGDSYTVQVRPWHRRDGDFGEVTVNTTESTTYEIDMTEYAGSEGLQALSQADPGTPVVALGTLDLDAREFTAAAVYGGTSVIADGIDAIHGNIVARAGDELSVKGVTIVRDDGSTRFRGEVTVIVGPNTRITKAGGSDAPLTADALSVGQRIVVFGQLDPTTDERILDASEGHVRMLVTRLTGEIVSASVGQINMNLRGIDRRGIDMFDFAGTGMQADLDADPQDYEVATGVLDTAGLPAGSAVRVFGFVSPFGVAPPDFSGRTIVDYRELRSALGIGWTSEGTAMPFQMAGPEGLVIDLANPDVGERHAVLVGGRKIDLFDLPQSPSIVPAAGRTLFSLVEPGHVELFRDFDEFVETLNDRLAAGDRARSMAAYGAYDLGANVLTANKIAIHLLPPE